MQEKSSKSAYLRPEWGYLTLFYQRVDMYIVNGLNGLNCFYSSGAQRLLLHLCHSVARTYILLLALLKRGCRR